MDRTIDAALARILQGGIAADCESGVLDFKEDRGNASELEDALVRAAVCFANAAGGTVVVGVCDKLGGPAAFTGTKLDAEAVRQRIHERTDPRLLVEVETRTTPARLLLVTIRPSATVHADRSGRSWQRVNRDCKPLTPPEVARLADERRGYDWSAEASSRNIADIPPDAFAAARALLRNQRDERQRLAELSDEDMLSALGVLIGRDALTRAGELLFCSAPGAAPDAMLYQYRQKPGGEPRTTQRPGFPLVSAVQRTLDLVAARQNTTPLTLPSGQQIVIEDFPQDAVREALSNAICHRDWRVAGVITVDHAPEILSVVSPGPLVAGVTPENILTITSHPRNPALAKAARLLGLAEETGRGVDRMYRSAIRSGKQVPGIEGHFDAVRVAFAGGAPDTSIARFVAQLPAEEQEDTDTMLLLHRFCTARTLTAEQAAPLLQKPVREAALILRRLAGDAVGLLEPTRSTAARASPAFRLRGGTLQRLGAAVAYNRRTEDETDRKVIAHLREYGRITNRTLQNMFDVGVFKARDILSDLSARGLVQRISAQTRGPKVEWGPGPGFPGRLAAKAPPPTPVSQAELPLANSVKARGSRKRR